MYEKENLLFKVRQRHKFLICFNQYDIMFDGVFKLKKRGLISLQFISIALGKRM